MSLSAWAGVGLRFAWSEERRTSCRRSEAVRENLPSVLSGGSSHDDGLPVVSFWVDE
jgi:hypothetical protein